MLNLDRIDIQSLLYTNGDYYLYEVYEDKKFIGKGKYDRGDVFLIFMMQFATKEQIKEFEKKGVIVVTNGNIERLFKKVGNPEGLK